MEGFSTLPLLFLAQVFGIIHAARRAGLPIGGPIALVSMLAGWGVLSAWLAMTGVFAEPAFLSAWPAFWITFVPVLIVSAPLALAGGRAAARRLVDRTPASWTVGFQALRVFALGGVLKAMSGDFSLYFALFIGVPDFLYGVSALWLARRGGAPSQGVLIAWHLLGAAIIVPVGLVILQMGLPGPWRVFTAAPGIDTIFAFPMVLAPTLVVPLFVLANLLTAARLLERRYSAAATG
jgi:hypothetical protein